MKLSRTVKFLKRRSRRVIGSGFYLGAVVTLLIGMNTFQWFWYDLKFGVEEILAAEGLSEILFAIQMFALVDLLPFFLVMSLTFVLCIGCSALVTGIVFSFLPMRFHAWLDGMMIAVPLVLVANISGLMELIDQRYRVFVVIVSFVLLMRFFCSGVWHRLPFNIVLKDSASSVVDVPLEVVRTRLDPNQTDDPADRAYFHGEILNELGEVSAQIEKSSDDEFTIREDFAGKGQYRETRFALKADGQSTEINIRTELTKLAPLAYWELWARPYAADYLDHLTARLANSRDRSAYGMCVARFRKAHDKKRAKILKARAT